MDECAFRKVESLISTTTMALDDNCVHLDSARFVCFVNRWTMVLTQMHSQKEILVFLHLNTAAVVCLLELARGDADVHERRCLEFKHLLWHSEAKGVV